MSQSIRRWQSPANETRLWPIFLRRRRRNQNRNRNSPKTSAAGFAIVTLPEVKIAKKKSFSNRFAVFGFRTFRRITKKLKTSGRCYKRLFLSEFWQNLEGPQKIDDLVRCFSLNNESKSRKTRIPNETRLLEPSKFCRNSYCRKFQQKIVYNIGHKTDL